MDNYFDLTSENIDNVLIIENQFKNDCLIYNKDKTQQFKGFILCKKVIQKTVCDVNFYRPDDSRLYYPRLVFKKIVSKTNQVKTTDKEDIIISFASNDEGKDNFWAMINFLSNFKEIINTGDFSSSYKVVDSNAFILKLKNEDEKEKIKQLAKIISLSNFSESSLHMALAKSRENAVKEFYDLLYNKKFDEYISNFPNVNMRGEEGVWHHFFLRNMWIIGLGIDIRFIENFINEPDVGLPSTNGIGSPKSDLMGISDYTLLVELKKSTENIFTEKKQNSARANTWSFTSSFIDGVSQCLAQKTDHEKTSKDIIQSDGTKLDRAVTRTVDPKTILIIGNKLDEFPQTLQTQDNDHKRDTFERFRKNNRNVDILTYDELYEKAYYIVHGIKPNHTINAVDLPF